MSETWEKGQKPVELPNPELNPLQNPTLGRNLGRWAQVYFTSPPEKREQAVGDLLRELQTETEPSSPRLEENSEAVRNPVPGLICEMCQQPNELGQKFCGLCGYELTDTHPTFQRPVERPAAMGGFLNLEQPTPQSPEKSVPPPATEDDDLQWLREKSLSRLAEPDESSGKWKYAILAVALLLATFGVLQWVSNRPVGVASHPATSPSPPSETVQQSPPEPIASETAKVADSQKAANSTAPPSVLPSQNVAPSADRHGAVSVPTSFPAEASVPANTQNGNLVEGGAQELYFAQGYLEGKHGRRDSTEAAKWLWKAVAKQNSTADILLANLYMTGDGVSKSCDQARLLLVAATQKGAPNAGEKLRSLETGGCR